MKFLAMLQYDHSLYFISLSKNFFKVFDGAGE